MALGRAYTLPPVAGLLLINPRAGTESPTAEELAAAARARGIEARVLGEDDDPVELARAADADVLGAAGGDGSVASVAAVAVERDLPFVVVPYGTRNHFARDLGLDRDDPLAALEAFEGEERRVDVGRVGRAALPEQRLARVYATLVHRREHHRRRRQLFAGLRALVAQPAPAAAASGRRWTASRSRRASCSSPTTPTS